MALKSEESSGTWRSEGSVVDTMLYSLNLPGRRNLQACGQSSSAERIRFSRCRATVHLILSDPNATLVFLVANPVLL